MIKLVELHTGDKVTLRKHYEELCRRDDISQSHRNGSAKLWLDCDQIKPNVVYTLHRGDSSIVSFEGKRYYHPRVLFKKVVIPRRNIKSHLINQQTEEIVC